MKSIALIATAAVTLAAASSASAAPADAARGKTLFGQQCGLCHSVVPGQVGAGPSLAGVVGRKAAADAKFPAYSKAMKSSGLTWTAATLETFLAAPTKAVPGTSMPIAVSKPDDRANIIAYLATLKAGK